MHLKVAWYALRRAPDRQPPYVPGPAAPTEAPPTSCTQTRFKEPMQLSRRDLLKVGLFSSAALVLPAERIARTQLAVADRMPTSKLPDPFTMPFQVPPAAAKAQVGNFDYFDIYQRQAQVKILPDKLTTIWGYADGPNGLPVTPGPTIYVDQKRPAVVRQTCELPERHPELGYSVWTSTHLHGSCSLPQYDGYASDTTNPGQAKDYHYPNIQDARTLWYHDHGVHITASNAYMGLAAQYILHDPYEQSLPIPHGDYDVPLTLKDVMFHDTGELLIDDNNQNGIYGDVILVNGVPWPKMQVEPRKYRFRVLNASVSRSYDLSLDSGEPLIVIGTDGGLMPHPQPCSHVKVGMAERYEIVIDFSKYSAGQRVVLKNTSPKNNIDYDTTNVVMAFEVTSTVHDDRNNEVPQDLNPNMNVMGLTEDSVDKDDNGNPIIRNIRFERKNSHWTVNGQTWEDVVNSDYELTIANPKQNATEIWELENPGGGWFHPVHIHLVDFKVLDRNGRAPEPYEKGPKDVVYVGESEKVRVIMKFEHQVGRYMMHCHNLVHEDHDMMVQFEVGEGGDDPIHADPCKDRDKMGALYERPREDDNRGRGNSTVSVPSSPAPAAPAPTPRVQVLGSKVKKKAKRKIKVKAKPKAKTHVKPKTTRKPKPKATAKKKAPRRKTVSGRGRS
jgi:spore coat protein A, manganese oxidase